MRVSGRFFMRGVLPAALFATVTATSAAAEDAENCFELGDLVLDGAFVTSADVVDAAEDMPAYCRVRAMALPSNSIEVRLPMEN